MAEWDSLRDREFGKFVLLNNVPHVRVTSGVSDTENDSALNSTIGAGDNDGTIDLAEGTTGQIVQKVRVAMPGATGDITITFYDGAAATTPISMALYLLAQPSDGFSLNKALTTGTLGYRISGWSSGGAKACLNVSYSQV